MPRPHLSALIGVCALATLSVARPAAAQFPVDSSAQVLQRELTRLAPADSIRGTLGVAVLHLESGRMVSVRGLQPFPMASTFKVPVAITLLRKVDQGTLRLDSMITLRASDIHPGSGTLLTTNPKGGVTMSLRALLEQMLLISDNSATDVVLRTAGGAPAVMTRLKETRLDGINVSRSTVELIGDAIGIPALPADSLRTLVRFDSLARGVSQADQDAAGRKLMKDPRDMATPEGMVRLLDAIWQRRVLRDETTRLLLDIMYRCQTGPGRIKGMLPDSTAVAHKTGTLTMGITNDIGIITLPGSLGHVAIALYLSGSRLDDASRERVLAQVARAAYDSFIFAPTPSRVGQ